MPKPSAGLLMYRHRDGRLEVLLAHPGGPLWASKDLGAWSIPKGQIVSGEDALDAARREFHERTGFESSGPVVGLGFLKQQPGGKIIHAWALEGDCDPAALRSGTFSIEWPPRSGKVQEFPEVDRVAWFTLPEALQRIVAGQVWFIRRLAGLLGEPLPPP